MDLSSITNITTEQYYYKQYYWLSEQGLWCYANDYVVSMSSEYANVGDRFRISTDTGNTYTVFVGDIKNNENTIIKKTNGRIYYNVIEFIVDVNSLDKKVRLSGNVGNYPNIFGKIACIEKIN